MAVAEFQYGLFYKYRAFGEPDSRTREHLRALLIDRQMYFASPREFNDLFDSRPSFVRGNPEDDRKAVESAVFETLRESLNERGLPVVTKRKAIKERRFRNEVNRIMAIMNDPAARQREFYESLHGNTGVFCMSAAWDIPTQWAYYADNGRGLCIEFDVTQECGFNRLYRVKYEEARPMLNMARLIARAKGAADELHSAVLSKAPSWSHEVEYRAMYNSMGVQEYPAGMLKSIILGPMCSAEDELWLRNLIAESCLDGVSLERAQTSDEDYSFSRVRCGPES